MLGRCKSIVLLNTTVVNLLCNGCEIRYKLLITINNDSLTTLILCFCCILSHFGITTVVKSLQRSQNDCELSNAIVVLWRFFPVIFEVRGPNNTCARTF